MCGVGEEVKKGANSEALIGRMVSIGGDRMLQVGWCYCPHFVEEQKKDSK